MKIEKRRYQERAAENFKKWIAADGKLLENKLATIILPTGVGKTATAALCLNTVSNKKVLWVAHREELIDQAKVALTAIVTGKRIEVEMADRKADPTADIVVGSVQTLARNRKHFQGFTPDIIVIDEYHHYSENNIQYDGLLRRWQDARILGLTATPWRSSGENLPLGTVLIKMDIGTAVDKGYLVTPTPEVLASDVSLADVKTKMGDFETKSLSKAVNVESRNRIIAKRIIDLVKKEHRQGILFGVDVEHSKAIYDLLKTEVRAAQVYGETPTEERRDLMTKIRNQEIDVLCNNLVATEGFDVPHLSFVVIARPTKSLGLFIQMAGRGLRTAMAKTNCIIVDVYDKLKAKQSRSSFQDLASNGDLYGEKKRAVNVLTADVPVDDVAKSLVNFPIFVKPDRNVRWPIDDESFPISSWQVNDSQWLISWVADIKIPKMRSKAIWIPFDELPENNKDIRGKSVKHDKFGDGTIVEVLERGTQAKVLVDFGWGTTRVMQISSLQRQGYVPEHIPDQYELSKTERLFLICMPENTEKGRLLSFEKSGRNLVLQDDLRFTKDEIDIYLRNQANADGNLQLVKSDAKWKKHPATEKQIEYIENLMDDGKIAFDLDLETLTKGDISSIIEQVRWADIIVKKFGTDQKTKLLGYDASMMDM